MLYIDKNLKSLRVKKGWTQEEMAVMLSITPQSISKWERGETYPDITMLPALAHLFHISVDELIGMDKINDEKAIHDIFKAEKDDKRNGDYEHSAAVLTEALKTFPNNRLMMSELAQALALTDDQDKIKQAAELCERVLEGSHTDKVGHTTRAQLCFIYWKLGEYEKAYVTAKSMPHLRESQESIIAALNEDKKTHNPTRMNEYLRFIAIGDDDAQDIIEVEVGINFASIEALQNLFDQIRALRDEATPAYIPQIRIRDNISYASDRVTIRIYADKVLDETFTNAQDMTDRVMQVLQSFAKSFMASTDSSI
jgi:transcriptional regulator with XRE-family HTH domain